MFLLPWVEQAPEGRAIIVVMKNSLFGIFLLLLAQGSGSFTPLVAGDLPVCQLEIRLIPDQHLLEGTARLVPREIFAASAIAFRLSPQAELQGVSADGKPVGYRFDGGLLTIDPDLSAGLQSVPLVIDFRVRYADPLPETTVGMEDPSFGVSAVIGKDGSYLSAGTAWYPRPVAADARYRIRVEGPAGLYAVTSGKLLAHGVVNDQSYTLWDSAFALEGLALAAGRYRIFEEQAGGIQVLAFLAERNAGLAKVYLDSTRKYLQFYQELLGPYPFAKFAVVENFLPTGYGLPSWTLLGSNVIALPFIPYTSLPHEIVHSWFGNAVEVDYSAGNWAEGLTSYLADYLLQEQRSDEQGKEHRLRLLRDYAALVPVEQDYPLSRFVSRSSKADQAIGYGKSAMVFHMLRQKVGEEVFWSALRRVATMGEGQRLGWNDLQRFFSDASGEDLAPFFSMWVERSGAPRLRFENVAVIERDDGWIVRGMLVQSEPGFHLNVPLRLQSQAGVIEQTLAVSSERTPFAIRTEAPPLLLQGDPDAHLFRRLHGDELPATINDLRASRRLLVVARTTADPLLDASADLLRGLQQAQAPVVTWDRFDPALAERYDLLFIGWPAGELLSGFGALRGGGAGNSFDWDGRHYQDPADSLFVCRKGTQGGQHLVAVFHPLSVDAARKVARKIPHYGRYSHLVFRDGANLVKGTADPATSPLRIELK
ncbi:MAG: M1 family aminopeptidase [Desulfuromonadales bacterium]|nr:M1 family aminopeptidase [Desulfuromonadales bacterium]